MKIYLRVPPNADCGVAYYRQWLPLMEAQRQGLCEVRVKHFTWGEKQGEGIGSIPVNEAELLEDLAWCDIAYFGRNDTPTYLTEAVICQEKFGKPTVVDYDDDVWATRPYNPGYRSFYPNSAYREWNLHAAKVVYDGMTVSTKYLKNKYDKYNSNIFITPNSLDLKERDKWRGKSFDTELYKKKKNEIRIGWSGSASHYENLKFIEPVIRQIMREFPNTTFYQTGLFGDLFDFKEFGNRIKSVPFVNLKDYPRILAETNIDIAIAPLTDCDFNRAKSNLRILEYGSIGCPVIASKVEPYNEFAKECILCTEQIEWYKALKKLIKNEKLRKEYGEKLLKKVYNKYDASKNCVLWINALKDILDKYDRNKRNNK